MLFVLRCMIDMEMVGGCWLRIPKESWQFSEAKESHCQIEVDVGWEQVKCFSMDERADNAPFRILSFDIECAGRKGVFPEAEKDHVIQIANYVTEQGSEKPFVRNIFTLRKCSSIVGAEVYCFEDEREMLKSWRDFVVQVDPDIVTGYNIANFDLPYLIKRCNHLKVKDATFLGKIKNKRSKVKDATFSSKAYGVRESKETTMEGRVTFDVLQVIHRDYKLTSYTLNNVSAEFLGEQKEEVHHSIISDLWNGTDEDRRRLAVYCLKDAYLPQRLLDKLLCLVNYIEMARVTGVPLSFLLAKGQQIKVVSQLFRAARGKGIVVPVYEKKKEEGEVSYAGATVLEPKKGFYEKPISTLDFASLYPSIMIAHNLCYTTLIKKETMAQFGVKEEECERSPSGDLFVKSSLKKGLLPEILENLLSQRSKAKNDLKEAKDPFLKMIYNGRQLALKISANSVYGFTGATMGKLPCLEISASVTSYGREMLEMTKKLVLEKFNTSNGYPFDADVVYGDTDSVMVKFGVEKIEEAMEYGKEAAKEITKHFKPPIKLEFEKCYYPYLLISKKRYAGLYWTKTEKWDKMDTKGIEVVRRDNCALVRNVITTVLNKILIDKDVDAAVDFVKEMVSDLLGNRLDVSLLVISKMYSKKEDQYKGKQPHIELAKRMHKRDPGSAPHVGDRVPYVIVQSAKGSRAFEKAEDPLFVLEHNIPIDFNYYLNNQLANPVSKIFKPILKNPSSLLNGEHTRSRVISTPKAGGIVAFAKKRLSCLNCKTALKPNQRTVCDDCKEAEPIIYQKLIHCTSKAESEFAAAWTQCQRCQGSVHQTVLCTARDCPIFYRRKKVQKDLTDLQETLDRFNQVW